MRNNPLTKDTESCRDEVTRILDDLPKAKGIDVDRLRRETRDEIDRYEQYRKNDPLVE